MDSTRIHYQGQQVDVLALMRHIMSHEVSARYSPWFFSYYKDLTDTDYMARYLRFLNGLLALRPGGIRGLRVLDAGCGFGIMSTLMALLGAQEVHGLDCHRGMIETFRMYLDILPHKLPVYPHLGDVAAMPYDDSYFDLLISNESISHYRDIGAFFSEAHRVLRPGGSLIISDSNNGMNSRVVRETWAIWKAFEQGPATANIHGHRVERPFVEQRATIIRRDFPALSSQQVADLAAHTAGLWGEDLQQAVRGYLQTGQLPPFVYREGSPALDPIQGFFIERLVHPYHLADELRHLGFETRVLAYLGGARGGILALLNDLATWLPQTLVLPHARSFRVLAHRPDSATVVRARTEGAET
jgi:2-polyprenyl-3-methyl-5-hydroxy-6-metoxy-1,4-benzoquinol methylase